jgi:hypothetical protein
VNEGSLKFYQESLQESLGVGESFEIQPFLGFHFEGSIIRTGEWIELSALMEPHAQSFFSHVCLRIVAVFQRSDIANGPSWVYGM